MAGSLPWTLSLVFPSAVPAGFWATQMYVPASQTEAFAICRLPFGSTVKPPPEGKINKIKFMMLPCFLFVITDRFWMRLDYWPVVWMLMPSFCQVMVGLGEPVAPQGRVMGLFRITSKEGGWDWITGSSEEVKWQLYNKCKKNNQNINSRDLSYQKLSKFF